MKARKIDEALSRGGDPLDTMGAGKNSPDTTYKKDLKDAVNQINGFWDDVESDLHEQLFASFVKWSLDISSAYEVSVEDVWIGVKIKLENLDPPSNTTDYEILQVLRKLHIPDDLQHIKSVSRNFNSRWMMTLDFDKKIKELWHEIKR